MVFTRPPTSKSSSPFNNPLVTVPKAPVTIIIIIITIIIIIIIIIIKCFDYMLLRQINQRGFHHCRIIFFKQIYGF